jgi:hypothetical protein
VELRVQVTHLRETAQVLLEEVDCRPYGNLQVEFHQVVERLATVEVAADMEEASCLVETSMRR